MIDKKIISLFNLMDLKIIDHDALLEMYGNCEEFN